MYDMSLPVGSRRSSALQSHSCKPAASFIQKVPNWCLSPPPFVPRAHSWVADRISSSTFVSESIPESLPQNMIDEPCKINADNTCVRCIHHTYSHPLSQSFLSIPLRSLPCTALVRLASAHSRYNVLFTHDVLANKFFDMTLGLRERPIL